MTGVIVLCRYNSSRLPGKILKEINGKPILQYIIERLDCIKDDYPYIVCTSTESTDDPIVDFCIKNGIDYYRGPLDNVALRFLDCAKENGFDNAARINGDNLFLDSSLIRQVIKSLELDNLNFISNVKDRTFPKGMSIEVVNTLFYEKSYPNFKGDDFEHVMTYFYRNNIKDRKYIYNKTEIKGNVNLAIDTLEDFKNAELILNNMDKNHIKYGYNDIINIFLKYRQHD